jgi:hypothetical protein
VPVYYMTSQRQTWTSSAGSVERKNYNSNEAMSGIVAPTGASVVTLMFSTFFTESGYDFVTVKSCATISCLSGVTQLGKFSGPSIPGPVVSNTGIMLIEWTSDGAIQYSGWSAIWAPPAGTGTMTIITSCPCSRQSGSPGPPPEHNHEMGQCARVLVSLWEQARVGGGGDGQKQSAANSKRESGQATNLNLV